MSYHRHNSTGTVDRRHPGNMIDVEWDSPEERHRNRRYEDKASTIHGWVTKMRGTLTGNERVRRSGIREMRAARAVREYLRQKEAKRREREGKKGFLSFFTPSRNRNRDVVVVRYDRDRTRTSASDHRRRGGSAKHKSKKGSSPEQPWMHFPRRSKPEHHGHGTRIWGHLTQDPEKVALGKAMHESATRQRDRERRRRERQRQRDAQKIKAQRASSRAPNWRG